MPGAKAAAEGPDQTLGAPPSRYALWRQGALTALLLAGGVIVIALIIFPSALTGGGGCLLWPLIGLLALLGLMSPFYPAPLRPLPSPTRTLLGHVGTIAMQCLFLGIQVQGGRQFGWEWWRVGLVILFLITMPLTGRNAWRAWQQWRAARVLR